jgi:RNA polymerase sigma-70 factor, ECF subfamily
VQEAWVKWSQADVGGLRSPQAWLVTVTTRLCVDRLRSLKLERATYVGPWLPEPVVAEAASPETELERAQHVSVAMHVVLERLGVEERAAFLLREVLDVDYGEIADALQRSEGACRQLVYRARQRLAEPGERFRPSPQQHRALVERFAAATATGDVDRIMALLSDDALLVADGGGVVRTVLRPLHGAQRIARFFHAIARQVEAHSARLDYVPVRVDGGLGLRRYFNGRLHSVISLETSCDRIVAIGIVANPAKMGANDALPSGFGPDSRFGNMLSDTQGDVT